jgi:para-nitrobenzyl esterase
MLDVRPHMYPKGGHPLDGVRMSENCLVLNVWSPSVGEEIKRPVMVWLHRGGFTAGSGGSVLYHGDQLAARGDVVVVNINHRLGIHGYLALEYIDPDQFPYAGNAGVLDIVQALEWVRDNIAEFGGDPNNVTIFGQTGGGMKIYALMAMPSAHGLFHKAISQRSPGMRVSEPTNAEALAHKVLEILGLSRHEVSKVRDLSMWDLLAIEGEMLRSSDLPFGSNGTVASRTAIPMPLQPHLDPVVLPEQPFANGRPNAAVADVPMLVGCATHDASLLILQSHDLTYESLTDEEVRSRVTSAYGDKGLERLAFWNAVVPSEPPRLRYARVVTDATFRERAVSSAEAKATQPAPVFLYEFAYQTPLYDGLLGCTHSLDLPFVFRNVDRTTFGGDREDRFEVSNNMALAWAAFAHNGSPQHNAIPQWKLFDREGRAMMRIDVNWESITSPEISVFPASPTASW